jgi:lipoprotein-releasing system permease protein
VTAARSAPGWGWRLPFAATLALRYLKSTRRDAFVTFLSSVAALGLALGVAALVIALAALSGFQHVLIAQTLSHTPHVEVELSPETPEADAVVLRDRLTTVDGVRSAQLVVRGAGWVLDGDDQAIAVELVGADGPLPRSVRGAEPGGEEGAGETLDGAPREPGLYLPTSLAARWGLVPGETLEVASPRTTLTPFGGPQPRVRNAVLQGLYEDPPGARREEVPAAVLSRSMARSLLSPTRTRIEIDAGDFDRAVAVAKGLGPALPEDALVRTWQDLERPLFFVLKLEKALIFVGVFLIVLVAALALVATLALVIANKRHELGTLHTLGATPRELSRSFLLLGGFLGGTAGLAGGLLGALVAVVLDRSGAVPLPGGVYFMDHVPFRLEPLDLTIVLALTAVVTAGASFYAARRVYGLRDLRTTTPGASP